MVEGHRGYLALHGRTQRAKFNLSNLKRDAKEQGEARGLLGSGGHGVMDGRAAVLWFQVEIVRGKRKQLGL